MAISCPKCGSQYDVTLFQFDRAVPCRCGWLVRAGEPQERRMAPPPRGRRRGGEAERLRRRADGITWMILYSDLPSVDVEIAINDLREHVRRMLPDRLGLFDMVYVARWQRLRDQGWARDPEA